LICLNEACAAISKGDCKSAIVGGTNIILAPALTTDISVLGTLSPDGSCKTFSSAANGYARGEGVVAIYIKSLQEAIRDGNPIRAVISGAATNCDGKTTGFTVPSAAAQESLIRHTYATAGIKESEISKTGFFECHGTGTSVGDSIEIEAITGVFGDSGGIHIGSIKPNLGHGEGASGLTAVLKAVLALENRIIPPNIKSMPLHETLYQNPRLIVPSEAIEWPSDRHERVSVNSFGIGGANAHVIIDSAASWTLSPAYQPKDVPSDSPQLLVYSAQTTQSLKDMTARYQKFLERIPENLSLVDIAYTLANRREHLPFRSFTVGTEGQPSIASFQTQTPSPDPPSVVMVFTGQGSQWPQMGREFFRTYPVFRRTVQSLDHHLQDLGKLAPYWRIEEELQKSTRLSRINEGEFSQPLCTALQIAVSDTLAAFGIVPAAVVGHSSGEIAAAYVAQAITARDAIVLAFYRGLVSKIQKKPGAMAAVGLSWKEVEKYLVPGVERACDNSPSSVTLSGDAEPLQKLIAIIKTECPGVLATTLKVEKAYHSYHMKEIGEEYYRMMKTSGISATRPSIPFFSSLTGDLLAEKSINSYSDYLGPGYWQKNLESPVLFNSAVSRILEDVRNPVFVEIGPHAALSGPLRQILTRSSSKALYISTMIRRKNAVEEFLKAIGKLWTLHVEVNLAELLPQGTCVPDLPSYPWSHQRSHWFESRVSKEWRMREHPHHDLLGVRVPECSGIEPVWRNLLHLDNAPWLRDHRVRKDIVFPLAGYIAIAAEGVRQISGVQEGVELRKVTVSTALVLREESPAELVTTFRHHHLTDSQESTWWEFVVTSYNGHAWTKHCFGQVRASTKESCGDIDIPQNKGMPHKVHIPQWYERARRAGSGYGYHFTTLEELRTSAGGAVGLGMAKARNNWHGDEANYHLHPVLVDTYLQLLSSAAHHGMRHGYRQLIPASVDFLAFSRSRADILTFYASCEPLSNGDGFLGAGSCVVDSKTVLRSSGVSVFPLAENIDTEVEQEASPTARSEWVPHIDFQNFSKMIRSTQDPAKYLPFLDLLAQVAITISKRLLSVDASEAPNPHMRMYKAWLNRQAPSYLDASSDTELLSRMDELLSILSKTAAAPIATAIAKVYEHIVTISSGERDGLDVLNTDCTLDKVQAFLKEFDALDFFQCIGHTYPNLRVLEVGAGLGTATVGFLKGLVRPSGQLLYSQYVYTDSLPGLVNAAKERFKRQANLEFATLDINIDPADQGFQDRKFDLIISTDVSHSKSKSSSALKHLRKLLSPYGRLLLQQPRAGLIWSKYILGVLPDWWDGTEVGLSDDHHGFLGRLGEELVTSGFQLPRDRLLESTQTNPLSTIVCVKPQHAKCSSNLVTLLCDTDDSEQNAHLYMELEGRGFQISRRRLGENLPAEQDVITLLDLEKPFLDGLNPESLDNLKNCLSSLDNRSGVFWVTKLSQTHCLDPSYGLVIGFARTVRSELDLDFATCETDNSITANGVGTLVDVFCKFYERDKDAVPGPDFEYSIDAGVVRVNRFFPFPLEDDLRVPENSDEAILRISRPGLLDSLYWEANPMLDLKGDEVQIVVHAVGLNFRVCAVLA
jgi:acyl transferase domain-containing protein